MYLKLAGYKVVDPRTGSAESKDIGVKDGVVDRMGEVKDGKADKILKARGDYACPALVDLHTHVYHLGTSLGVDADEVAKWSGTGVFVDAGSAGAGNFAGFRDHVIGHSDSIIYSFLNIGFGGIPFFGIQKDQQVGEIPDMRVADAEACAECVEENREHIVGIKVRVSEKANGVHGLEPLAVAKKCAKKLGIPVMAHFGRPPPSVREVVSILGKGDILTHTFRAEPNSIVTEDGKVMEELKDARKRGVMIDVGHGNGSFSFEVAKKALADGLLPDTISTDMHVFSLADPVVSLEATMTKLHCFGMSMAQVIVATTHAPATAIGRSGHGSITPGTPADLVTLRVVKRKLTLKDATGRAMGFDREVRSVLRLKGRKLRVF
jgi:dihydroorotase